MPRRSVDPAKSTTGRIDLLRLVASVTSRTSPALAARLAERLFLTPARVRRPHRESVWAAPARRGVVASPLGAIPFWSWGEGDRTTLLVHGWSGRGLQLGALVAPLVEQGQRVVTFDAPGHGEAAGRTSSLVAFAATIGAVGRRSGRLSAIVAHSLGSAAALWALAERELEADRMVAIAPSARFDAIRQRFGAMTGFSAPVVDRMRSAIAERLGFDWNAAEPLALARTMRMPLRVIHDVEDRFVPWSEGDALVRAWPGASLRTTQGLGHHRILRDRDVLDDIVRFVASPPCDVRPGRRAS